MSAHFHAVNNALNGGSKPEDLVTSPHACFSKRQPQPDGGRQASDRSILGRDSKIGQAGETRASEAVVAILAVNGLSMRWPPALPASAAPILRVPWFGIPLSPVCQGVLRPGQVTGGPWRGRKPDKCPGIDGQEEADWWPWQRGNRVGRRPRAEIRQPPYRVLRWPKFASRLAAFCSALSQWRTEPAFWRSAACRQVLPRSCTRRPPMLSCVLPILFNLACRQTYA